MSRQLLLGSLAAVGLLTSGCAASGGSTTSSAASASPTSPAPTATAAQPPAPPPPAPAPPPPPAESTPTPSASAPPAPAPAPADPVSCTTAHLDVALSAGSGGGAGSLFPALTFVNKGPGACTLQGFPGVSYVAGADGPQVGTAAGRVGAASLVTIEAGEVAHASLRIVNYHNYDATQCQPAAVAGYRVYPPDEVAAAFVPAAGTACAGTGVDLLTVQPVQSGPPSD